MPTDLGIQIVEFLVKNFEPIMEIKFTADLTLEKALEIIADKNGTIKVAPKSSDKKLTVVVKKDINKNINI